MTDKSIIENPLDYEDLDDLVDELGSAISASDLHGMITGELAAGGDKVDVQSLRKACEMYLEPQSSVSHIIEKELCIVISQTRAALEDADLNFAMMLPSDVCVIRERTDALAQWCQGFMFGFAVAEKKYSLALSENEDSAEVLQDFSAISMARVDVEATDDENEEDYMQLSEYVRVASMNLFAQCALAEQMPKPPSSPLTVH